MSSTKTKLFKFFWGNVVRPMYQSSLTTNISNKSVKHSSIKGYISEVKETENKTKYIRIKKDNNVESKKVIYYMHGGTYLYGLNNMYKAFACVLCDLRDDLEVILLDYSLAPQHTYPTQLNEAMDVWTELTKTFNTQDIVIGGDSAGGNLALVLIYKLKKELNLSPGAAFFFSPWTDMTCTSESFYRNYTKDIIVGGSVPLTKEHVEKMKQSITYSFIGDAERTDPYISPIFADYTTFPKSLFFVGGAEMLLDDTVNLVKKIRENPENEVDLIVKEGMFHVYPIYSFIPESKEAQEKIKEFIYESFI